MLQSIDYRKYHSVQVYYTAAAVLICLFTAFFLLLDLLQVHIYRHDAAYYLGWDGFFYQDAAGGAMDKFPAISCFFQDSWSVSVVAGFSFPVFILVFCQ